MGIYILSPEAEEDIFEIWRYLAEEVSADFANRVESELFEDFKLLTDEPGLGHKRQDLSSAPVLFFRAFPYQYMIIYQPKSLLGIVGIQHAKRSVKRILKLQKNSSRNSLAKRICEGKNNMGAMVRDHMSKAEVVRDLHAVLAKAQ